MRPISKVSTTSRKSFERDVLFARFSRVATYREGRLRVRPTTNFIRFAIRLERSLRLWRDFSVVVHCPRQTITNINDIELMNFRNDIGNRRVENGRFDFPR